MKHVTNENHNFARFYPAKMTEELYRKEQGMIRLMFDKIAYRYDFLNHFLSFGFDHLWRRSVVKQIGDRNAAEVLDIATGTGDLAIRTARKCKNSRVTGIDISPNMLEFGRKKIIRKKLQHQIHLSEADAEKLPYENNRFDLITVGFGVRNFEHLSIGLSEIFRVLKPGGQLIILEFSRPERFPLKHLYLFYFHYILTSVGKVVSRNKYAYRYFYDSVTDFPQRAALTDILTTNGFEKCNFKPLTGGITTLYTGEKPIIVAVETNEPLPEDSHQVIPIVA
ncbi:MAG: bifunctional demethylmenaquinone methyltransferase/2-methoxy-6-polyprenyl-1,4-benzoquinol methylase UbiE [Bacteroidetes bacterium]|nr:bifunctional demethylmenaquinone methyltransferase/2-methoxy-6-polyprenyl-1,4-benzoquinol methylase UbiE [Bacteroidota bacterium]